MVMQILLPVLGLFSVPTVAYTFYVNPIFNVGIESGLNLVFN